MNVPSLEDRHDRLHAQLVPALALGLLGQAGMEIAEVTGAQGPWARAGSFVALAGYLWFAVTLVRMSALLRRDDGGFLDAVTRDERVRVIRWRSLEWGFGATIVSNVVLAMASTRLPIDAEFTGMFSVGVGLLASVGRFVHLNR